MSGEPLAPVLAHVAAAQARGQIGSQHVRIAEKFFQTLPTHLDWSTREAAEPTRRRWPAGSGPEQFRQAAERLALLLNQDGDGPTKPGRGGATSRWASNARTA
jgi:hypothetical protein